MDDRRTLTPALLGLVWSAMFGFSGFFLSYSTMVSIGAIGGLATVTGGAVLTTMMIGVIAVQPFAPWLGARLGLRAALLVALGLQVLGQVCGLIVTQPLLSLVLAGVFGGMGFGLFVVLANAAVPGTVAPRRLGKALGIFGGITSLAAALGAPFGLWLIGVVPVWSFRLIACGTLLLAAPTIIRFLPGRVPVPPPGAARDGLPGTHRAVDADAQAADSGAGARGSGADVGARGSGPDAGRGMSSQGRGRLGEILPLLTMLAPFLIGMVTFGLIVGFGPGEGIATPAIYIGIMQVFSVIGRFAAGAVADARSPLGLNLAGVGLSACGLIVTAITGGGVVLGLAMAVVGLGLGTLQSASLVMAFTAVSTPARASVAWNMSFDIGLGIAGVIGGVGFTYLGDTVTFLLCAGILVLAGLVSWIVAARRAGTTRERD
ncbi:hypothetical protein GCM10009700_02230 [Brevibacterium sanguinis]|uniref:MFS transporter n=1 Tax=Brevibacterium sanguinis TaxID=232444 RepID=UPI0031D99964